MCPAYYTQREMKPNDLLLVFGNRASIAQAFAPINNGKPLTRSAMSQWFDAGTVPELREYQLRELMPDIDKRIALAKKRQPEEARA